MKKLIIFSLMTIFCLSGYTQKNVVLIEAEGFTEKGGWLVDPQFVEQMSSPFIKHFLYVR
jgi:hypothetical protein